MFHRIAVLLYCGTIIVDGTVRVDRLGGRPYLIVRYLRIPPKFWGPRISVLFCLLSSSRDKGTHPPLVLTPLQYQQNLTWESVSNKNIFISLLSSLSRSDRTRSVYLRGRLHSLPATAASHCCWATAIYADRL